MTDRFAEKEPSLTPYQYAGNDPVRIIDVNGDSLWVNDGRNDYYYDASSSSFVTRSGTVYSGGNRDVDALVAGLGRLQGSSSFTKVLNKLADNVLSSTIVFSTSNQITGRNLSGNTINLNLRNPRGEVVPLLTGNDWQAPEFSIAHEFYHAAVDLSDGNVMNRGSDEMRALHFAPSSADPTVARGELNATIFETRVRLEMGAEPRMGYRMIDRSMSGAMDSRYRVFTGTPNGIVLTPGSGW